MLDPCTQFLHVAASVYTSISCVLVAFDNGNVTTCMRRGVWLQRPRLGTCGTHPAPVPTPLSEGERPAMMRTAEQQHGALLRTLRAKDEWSVLFHPIILGTTGAVYTDTLQTLMELGVGTRDGNTLLAQLHTHAVGALASIWRQRQHNMQGLCQQPDRPAYKARQSKGIT